MSDQTAVIPKGSEEQHSIAVVRYRTVGGEPTCAIDFPTGKVCNFLRTRSFGTLDVCLFDTSSQGYLKRRGANGLGTLIPMQLCPVWEDITKGKTCPNKTG